MADIYFWRQSLILLSGVFFSLSMGFVHGFPSALNSVMLSPNSTDLYISRNHASWLAAFNGIGGFFGVFLQAPVMQLLGRKASNYSSNAFHLLGWIILIFAKNIPALYAARLIQGIAIGSIYINSIIIGEYVHPKRRGYFISLKKAFIAIGTLICHAMSGFWTWRQIAIFGSTLPSAAIVLTFFWPESPSHLALKGKFTECEESFKWLNGNSEESQRHLKLLVEAQKKRIRRQRTVHKRFIDVWKTFLKKDFQKSFLVTTLLTLSIDLCGRYYFAAYAVQIMMELMNNKTSAMYFTLGTNIFTVLALFLSVVVIRYVKRRTFLFWSGVCVVFLMLSISILVYLKSVYTFSTYFYWFIAAIIVLECFIVNIGLIPVSFTIIGEIFPLEDKGVGSWASSIVFTSFYATTLKVTPLLMESIGLYGTLAIYGVGLALCLACLYKIVPETKDKTLQEIEDELTGVKFKEMILIESERLMHRVE